MLITFVLLSGYVFKGFVRQLLKAISKEKHHLHPSPQEKGETIPDEQASDLGIIRGSKTQGENIRLM